MFGLEDLVLASVEVRGCGFGTWFFQRECETLGFEIERSANHPSQREKKGASLCTVTNVLLGRYGRRGSGQSLRAG